LARTRALLVPDPGAARMFIAIRSYAALCRGPIARGLCRRFVVLANFTKIFNDGIFRTPSTKTFVLYGRDPSSTARLDCGLAIAASPQFPWHGFHACLASCCPASSRTSFAFAGRDVRSAFQSLNWLLTIRLDPGRIQLEGDTRPRHDLDHHRQIWRGVPFFDISLLAGLADHQSRNQTRAAAHRRRPTMAAVSGTHLAAAVPVDPWCDVFSVISNSQTSPSFYVMPGGGQQRAHVLLPPRTIRIGIGTGL